MNSGVLLEGGGGGLQLNDVLRQLAVADDVQLRTACVGKVWTPGCGAEVWVREQERMGVSESG